MTASVDKLTEGQKACLHLFYRRYSMKEIGRELGISPDAVKMRLKNARAILGVTSSMEAARLLAEAEQGAAYPDRVYPEQVIADQPQSQASSLASELPLPFPTRWRPSNDLSFFQKLTAICGLAAFFMIAIGIYFIGIRLLSASL